MQHSPPADASPVRHRRRLRNEIAAILVLKVIALALLSHFFFSGSERDAIDSGQVAQHLLPAAFVNQQ